MLLRRVVAIRCDVGCTREYDTDCGCLHFGNVNALVNVTRRSTINAINIIGLWNAKCEMRMVYFRFLVRWNLIKPTTTPKTWSSWSFTANRTSNKQRQNSCQLRTNVLWLLMWCTLSFFRQIDITNQELSEYSRYRRVSLLALSRDASTKGWQCLINDVSQRARHDDFEQFHVVRSCWDVTNHKLLYYYSIGKLPVVIIQTER